MKVLEKLIKQALEEKQDAINDEEIGKQSSADIYDIFEVLVKNTFENEKKSFNKNGDKYSYNNTRRDIVNYLNNNSSISKYLEKEKSRLITKKREAFYIFCKQDIKPKDACFYLNDANNFLKASEVSLEQSSTSLRNFDMCCISSIAMFYNIEDESAERILREFINNANQLKIQMKMVLNYTHIKLLDELKKCSDATVVFSSTERFVSHFNIIFTMKNQYTTGTKKKQDCPREFNKKYIIKYDELTNINFSIADNSATSTYKHKSVSNFLAHHEARISSITDSIKEPNDRHNAYFKYDETTPLQIEAQDISASIVEFSEYTFKDVFELKKKKKALLIDLNTYRVVNQNNIDTTLFQTLVWLLFSIKKMKLKEGIDSDNRNKIMDEFNNIKDRGIIWDLIRSIKPFLKSELDIPIIGENNLENLLKDIHFPRDSGKTVFSNVFPEKSFPSHTGIMYASLEKIVWDKNNWDRLKELSNMEIYTKDDAVKALKICLPSLKKI